MTDEAEDGGPGRKPGADGATPPRAPTRTPRQPGPPPGSAEKAPTTERALPAKTATKTGAKKTAAKKTVAKKTAVPKAAAKGVVAKKVAAPTVVASKRPQTARKAPARKAPAKKAPAKKAPAKKAKGPERAPAATKTAPPPPPPPPVPPPVPDPPPPQWPAPQWPPPAWPPPPPNARTREGLATGALVTGIVSIPLVVTLIGSGLVGVVAIVLAVAALARIRAHPERSGRGMAIAGLVTGVVGVGLTVLVLALPDDGDDNELDTVSYLDLAPGDCYERELPLFAGVTLEDCTFPHDREVVGVVEHPDPFDAPFPGRQALERKAMELCRPEYDAYLGPDADRALFVQQNLQPTRGAWREGNRTIVCSVERADRRPLIGSVKDVGGALNR